MLWSWLEAADSKQRHRLFLPTKPYTMFDLTLNQIGLLSDIAGAILLFIYGLPSKYVESKSVLLSIGTTTPEEAAAIDRKNKRISIGAHLGIILLLLGFIFQFAGSYK